MLSGLGSDLAPRGFCGFSLPRRPAHRQPGPPRADSNLPPGPRCPPPGEGPGPHLTEVQLSPQARCPGAGLHLAAGRPRGAGGFPCPGAGRWAVPGRGGCGRPSSRGGVGGGGLANFAELSPPAGRRRPPARAGFPCAGRTREPLRAVPSRGSPPPPGCRGSPHGFAPCRRRGCCLPGRWVALPSGWSLSRRSLPAVAH